MVKQKTVKAKLQKKISSKKMIVETFIFMIFNIYIFYLIYISLKYMHLWGLGIGDWGLGIGDWAQSPIPRPPSPIPTPPTQILNYRH